MVEQPLSNERANAPSRHGQSPGAAVRSPASVADACDWVSWTVGMTGSRAFEAMLTQAVAFAQVAVARIVDDDASPAYRWGAPWPPCRGGSTGVESVLPCPDTVSRAGLAQAQALSGRSASALGTPLKFRFRPQLVPTRWHRRGRRPRRCRPCQLRRAVTRRTSRPGIAARLHRGRFPATGSGTSIRR